MGLEMEEPAGTTPERRAIDAMGVSIRLPRWTAATT
jgi:hypothetical protein